jgi:serine/threonine protein kinase/class 3 adenylate cyclase
MADLKTILFTDIVGSVDLKSEMPGGSDTERDQAFIAQVLTPHRERIERELAVLGGRVVSTAGDGHFLVFSDTISAARWAIGIERSHRDEPIGTPHGKTVAVRISMHVGIPQIDPRDPNNFIGKPVDYAARLSDYATGEQILVSRSVVAVLEDAGMDGVSFHNHGRWELKGIGRVEVFEMVYDRAEPHQMRASPRENYLRQWTVLPPTMGLTEFRDSWRGGAKPPLDQARDRQGASHSISGRPSTDVVPLRLGNYELEERLGSGGMGDVYKARHTQFGRVRAVKVIKQQFVDTGHDEVIRRFYQEIKAVGGLEHPNIVVAIDSSAPTDSVHYLVMEYIEGVGADELVGRYGPLAVADACEIARQAARGLAYIHQHGMVHRDVKPSNLMLALVRTEELASDAKPQVAGEQVVVKILDLGLALLVGDDQQRLTVFDARAMGTAMYMSPEQWKTTSVDIRADIYSLGCTLYHLLAGKPPFWHSDLKPEKAHERAKLPPIEREPGIPRGLWAILQRMTAKNPRDRYSNPAEVAAALAPFAEGNQVATLVEETLDETSDSTSRGNARSDTMIGNSAGSDTLARPPASRSWGSGIPPRARRRISRISKAALLLAAVVAIGWLAVLATGRRESAHEAVEARQRALVVAAQFASSEILKEINRRFDILGRLASEPDLRQQLIRINGKPKDEALWERLEDWLGARKADHAKDAASDSWFINDARGVQVARSPRSEATRGENFAYRDYFSGLGTSLPADTKDVKPLKRAHLSAVYRSTSTGHLKVAFSVPIENGKKGKERDVIGILAMTVDCGAFNVLENKLPKGMEVVLIDLRESTVDGRARRGLILHHQKEQDFGKNSPPPWIGNEVLTRIEGLLQKNDAKNTEHRAIMANYRDDALTSGALYSGALEALVDKQEDAVRESDWVVLVQEPAKAG